MHVSLKLKLARGRIYAMVDTPAGAQLFLPLNLPLDEQPKKKPKLRLVPKEEP